MKWVTDRSGRLVKVEDDKDKKKSSTTSTSSSSSTKSTSGTSAKSTSGSSTKSTGTGSSSKKNTGTGSSSSKKNTGTGSGSSTKSTGISTSPRTNQGSGYINYIGGRNYLGDEDKWYYTAAAGYDIQNSQGTAARLQNQLGSTMYTRGAGQKINQAGLVQKSTGTAYNNQYWQGNLQMVPGVYSPEDTQALMNLADEEIRLASLTNRQARARSGDASVLAEQDATIKRLKAEGRVDSWSRNFIGADRYTNQDEIDAAWKQYEEYVSLLKLSGMEDLTGSLPKKSGMINYSRDSFQDDLMLLLYKAQGYDIDADEYNAAVKRARDFIGGAHTDVVAAAEADPSGRWMDSFLNVYDRRMNTLNKHIAKNSSAYGTEYAFDADDYIKYMRDLSAGEKRAAEIEQRQAAADQKVQDKWGGLENEPDFATYSQHKPHGGSYYDEYDVLNWQAQVNDMVALGADPKKFKDAASLLSLDPTIDTEAYAYLEYGLQHMDDLDRARFFYLYNNPEYGPDAALEFLDDISYRTMRKHTEDYQKAIAEGMDGSLANSVAGTIAIPFYGMMNSVASLNTMAEKAGGKTFHEYDPNFLYGTLADTITGEVGRNIAEATPWAPKVFGQNIFQMGYNAVTSAATSAANVAAFGPAGSLSMGFSAFNSSYRQGLADGKPDMDAFVDALVDGGIEVGTEAMSIDALMGDSYNPLGYFLKNIFTEGLEEGIGSGARMGYDQLKYGIESQINRRISELTVQGYDPTDATKMAWKEWLNTLGQDVAVGSISGAVMSGPAAAASQVQNYQIENTLKENLDEEGIGTFLELTGSVAGELSRSGKQIYEDLKTEFAQEKSRSEKAAKAQADAQQRKAAEDAAIAEDLNTESAQDELIAEKAAKAQTDAQQRKAAEDAAIAEDLSSETAQEELQAEKNKKAQADAQQRKAAEDAAIAEDLNTESTQDELIEEKNKKAQADAQQQKDAAIAEDLNTESAQDELIEEKNKKAQTDAQQQKDAKIAADLGTESARNELAPGKNKKAISRGKVGQLYREVQQLLEGTARDTLREYMSFNVAKELRNLGVPSKDAKSLAESVLRIQDGNFTEADKQAVNISEAARTVLAAWTEKLDIATAAQGKMDQLGGLLAGKAKSPASVEESEGEPLEITDDFDAKLAELQEQEILASEGETSTLNGEEIEILGEAAPEKGTPMLKIRTAGGEEKTVKAKSIAYSENDATVYARAALAAEYGEFADIAFDGIQPGQDVIEYARDFHKAAQYGSDGKNLDVLKNSALKDSALSDAQIEAAYEVGRIMRAQRNKAQQQVRSVKGAKVSVGNVDTSAIRGVKLSHHQRSSIAAMARLAQPLGINVRFVKSRTDARGYYTDDNGAWNANTRTLTLSIDAGGVSKRNIRFAMMDTAGHELTHYVKQFADSELWDEYQDFIISHLDSKENFDLEKEIQKLMAADESLDRDGALEEVIADASVKALSKISEQDLADLAESNPTLFGKIKKFLTKWAKSLKRAINEAFDSSMGETNQIAKAMNDVLDEMAPMWNTLLANASQNAQESRSAVPGVEIDTESQTATIKNSRRSLDNSDYAKNPDKMAAALAKAIGVPETQAKRYIKNMFSIAKIIAGDQNRLDYEGNPLNSVLKDNSEYRFTVDMSTLCAKRLIYTGTLDAIQKAMPNTVLSSEDLCDLRSLMMDRDYEVACGICYVESRRRELGSITKGFVDAYNDALAKGEDMMLGPKNNRQAFPTEGGNMLTLADVNTTEGIENIQLHHPKIYAAYMKYMNSRGVSKPKLIETRTDYRGEILQLFNSKRAVNDRNENGGLRIQSFSDFEVVHLIDMMQVITDMAQVGLTGQAYTKVPNFAEAMGRTGLKINLSLIAKGDGVDADGNLIFDDIEGMPAADAFRLRKKYSKNVGTILVGKSDEHIRAALADPRIDFVIPFHKSGWSESLYAKLGLTNYSDYTNFQNERAVTDSSFKWDHSKSASENYAAINKIRDKSRHIDNFLPMDYWDFNLSGEENAQNYLEACYYDGRIPKFPQFVNEPGYWKLLIDFKMYDNNGVGSPQLPVKPDFNMTQARRMLKEYDGSHTRLPVAQDVVDDFVKQYKARDGEFSDDVDVKASARVMDAETLSFLDSQETVTTYKTMQVVNGKLYPPMAAVVAGKYEDASELGTWEQAVERPDLIKTDKKGKPQFALNKGQGKGIVPAAYNPYMHSSNLVLNDQFSSAYDRPNLVTVECEVPVSELTSGYHAQYAKDTVGWHSWHTGTVAGALRKAKGIERQVLLSRWIKPVRIVPDSEVAAMYKELLDGTGIAVPDNVVPPSLLAELKNAGVAIAESGKVKTEPDVKRMARDNIYNYSQEEYNNFRWATSNGILSFDEMEHAESKIATLAHGGMPPGRDTADGKFAMQLGKEIGVDNVIIVTDKKLGAQGIDRVYRIKSDHETFIEEVRDTIYEFESAFGEKSERHVKNVWPSQIVECYRREDYPYVQDNSAVGPRSTGVSGGQLAGTTGTLQKRGGRGGTSGQTESVAKSLLHEQVDSDGNRLSFAQKSYFKDSKARDENGNLLVLYHGTRAGTQISVFKTTEGYRKGLYLTDIPKVAEGFASKPMGMDENGKIKYADIKYVTKDNFDDYDFESSGVYKMYANVVNPFIVDAGYAYYYNIQTPDEMRSDSMYGNTVDTQEINAWAYENGYDGVIVRNVREGGGDYPGTDVIVFDKNQVKFADNDAPTADPDIRHQMRDPYNASDRELLADALESLAANADELDILRRYQKRIQNLDAKQQQLQDVEDQLHALKQGDVKANRDEIIKLTNNANTIANQIDRMDKELLKLEVMAPIKKLADRERAAYKEKLKAKTDEQIRRYKDRLKMDTQDKIREIREREAEKRQKLREQGDTRLRKAVQHTREVGERRIDRMKESDLKTKYKARLQKDVGTMREWLTKPTNKGHVPQFLRAPLADFLESLDFSSDRSLKGGDSTQADAKMLEKMEALRKALANTRRQQTDIENGEAAFRGYLDLPEGFADQFDEALTRIKATLARGGTDTPINRMTGEQLKDLSNMIRAINTAVRQMNSFLANSRYQKVSEAARNTLSVLGKLGDKISKSAVMDKVSGFLDWTNTTPYYAFKRFGEGGKAIFEALMTGWDKLAFNSKELIDYANSVYTTKQVRAWSQELHTIDLNGKQVQMTTAQIMSLYCLNKREQARGHLLGGGIRIADIQVKGKTITQADNHTLDESDIQQIIDLLTNEQIAVADKLQHFMNTRCTEWGNEVSMKRFGYEAFGDEANYFPIESDSNNLKGLDAQAQENSLFRLLNLSATKSTVKNANNALVVRDIFDVFSAHGTDMAKYNALALPILDALKWYNFVDKTNFDDGSLETQSIQKALEKAYGKDAQKYIRSFLKDLNGVREGGRNDGLVSKMISNYKIAAVANNLRVGMLQITSMPRAAYAINPKYLAIGAAKNVVFHNSKAATEKVGIGLWKSLGFYDTNISRNVREMVKHDQNLGDRIKEKSMILAEKGDAWTMGVLYGAVEAEMADKHPGVKKGSEVYDRMVNDRMREIVYQTQVVDSTMTRSDIMRDTKGLSSLTTAFMSEPTLTMNMLADSIFEQRMRARETGKKFIAPSQKMVKAFAVNAFVLTFSAVMESLFTAWRDDDEYETFEEKFNETFTDTLLDNFNLANNLPFVKDIIGAIQGQSADRMDSAWAVTLYGGMKEIYKYLTGQSTNPAYNGIYKTLNGLSQMSGYAVGGLARELVSAYNNVIATPMGYKRIQTYENSASDAAKAIINAHAAGDEDLVARYLDIAAMHGVEGEKLETAVKKVAKEAYGEGKMDADAATQAVIAYGGQSENDAYWLIQNWEYTGEGNFSKYTKLKTAMAEGDSSSAKAAYRELVEHGVKEETIKNELSGMYNSGEATNLLNLQMRSDQLYNSSLKLKTDGQKHKDDFDAFLGAIVNGGNIAGEISKLKNKGYSTSQCMSAINGAFGKSSDRYRIMEKYNSQDARILLDRILDAYEVLGLDRDEEIDWINENWTMPADEE